jgi:chromosome segregation ATPase
MIPCTRFVALSNIYVIISARTLQLTHETKRVLQLESDLNHRSDELRNEKIMSQNLVQTLAGAQEKIKVGELEARELQANLESLSHTSDGHNTRNAKLERDKNTLESRVRELEANLRQLSSLPSIPEKRGAPRPRSSSLTTFRISSLEQELNETRISLAQKENDLQAANQSLSQARDELLRMGNEKEAVERRVTRELAELHSSLEQKEDELQYWRGQQDNGRREEELMMRIEEDDAKITMLEKLLADTEESPKLRDKLEKAEEKLKEEKKRKSEYETRNVELVKEKEDALDELGHAQREISRLIEASKQDIIVNGKGYVNQYCPVSWTLRFYCLQEC